MDPHGPRLEGEVIWSHEKENEGHLPLGGVSLEETAH